MKSKFFPKKSEVTPKVYAYELPNDSTRKGELKIGQTNRSVLARVTEQVGATRAAFNIVLEENAMRNDGSTFSDHDIHNYLRNKGFYNSEGEWFECTVEDVSAAIIALKSGEINEENRSLDFSMRPEQKAAVEKTSQYFKQYQKEGLESAPQFLWNAKMRFGKTFTTYQLAKEMSWSKVLVLTFKPAVQNAWKEDLMMHVDFEGWQFISKNGNSYEDIDPNKPFVCFGSFQDYLGKNTSTGGVKTKNEWVHATHWDCVVFDEYHFGAWNENSKGLFNELYEDGKDEDLIEFEKKIGKVENFDADIIPITTDHFLYLSGTPFRAINSGEFIEEQILNWTYSDEQNAKEKWEGKDNPYLTLPRMVMLTYQMPDSIREIALGGEFNEFDLNVFFAATGEKENARFKMENEVQKWLDLIRGNYAETNLDNLKLGAKKPPMPFSDSRLLSILNHTFWFLPTVASCHAMKNLMMQMNNLFYQDYEIIVAAGTSAGIGVEALPPVLDKMRNPLKSKTITLSCGKLTTGVSVKPWTGIFMLRNSSSPETYFQAAFRVQTPWAIKNPDGESPNKVEIIKKECYVFDFAPNRALSQVADYACRLNINESNPEKNVAEFIHFLPVLAYDGSSMKQVDAAGVLDIAMSGTSATLLARRWESALLVNVDNSTLARLMKNQDALDALMSIEGFRSLNQDIETIINKSEAVKKAKKEANEEQLTPKKKKELTKEEKEYKSLRKKIQEKLIKFATRIPVFMYLTDFREHSLKDVITQLEPGLFKKVTGLEVSDFELLVSLGVFNSSMMNDAVYKFKRYEDASLEYIGINKHEGQSVGGFDTVLTREDYNEVFVNKN
ncbi:MAG: GIY-YIG nuclease family protein [Flavobacteriaceae bacterium]